MTSGSPRWGQADQPTRTRRFDARSPRPARARPRLRLPRLGRGGVRRSPRTVRSSAHAPERGAEPGGTPDRSKLVGSHGQRPWLHNVVTWDSSGPRRSSIPSGPVGSHHCLRSGPSTASSGVGACWTGGIGSGGLLRLRGGICRRWPAAVGNSTASISSRDWSSAAAPRSRSSTASRSMAAWSRPGLVARASRRSSWSSAWSSIGGSSACRATPSSTTIRSSRGLTSIPMWSGASAGCAWAWASSRCSCRRAAGLPGGDRELQRLLAGAGLGPVRARGPGWADRSIRSPCRGVAAAPRRSDRGGATAA